MYTCGECGNPGVEDDNRNILDVYRHYHVECIRKVVDLKRNDLVIICENISGDFNLSSVMRSGNQFSVREFCIAGRRRYDKRGAVGTNHYEHISFSPDISEPVDRLRAEGYTIVAADNVDGAEPLGIYQWNPKTAIIFGEEQRGLSQEALDTADDVVYIETRGTARSLNIASAATVMMYDYCNKM